MASMNGQYDYDVAIVGGGSGGLAAAFRAAAHGARVALLEPADLGGTCVNLGCVPKKAMWLAADLSQRIELAAALGFAQPAPALSWPQLLHHRQRYIANIHASYRHRLERAGIAVIPKRGRLGDAHTLVCDDGARISAADIVIATGSYPQRPAFAGAELGGVSDDFFRLKQAPERVAIIGGGYIAVELAGVLQALGSAVQLFVRGERLLKHFDTELSAQLSDNLRQQGINIHYNSHVRDLHGGQHGRIGVRTSAQSACEYFDQVLFALGRRANSGGLGLERVGVELGDEGQILVDDWQATTVPGIYALGDVTGKLGLTPVAITAARKLMDRLFGDDAEARMDYQNVPSVVFSHPPLGQVGLTEESARVRHGDAVRVYTTSFRPMLQALADSPQRSLFKLVCVGEEERVVGIHLLGDGADEMLQGFAVALKMGVTKRQMEDTLAIHPTSAEEVVLMR